MLNEVGEGEKHLVIETDFKTHDVVFWQKLSEPGPYCLDGPHVGTTNKSL